MLIWGRRHVPAPARPPGCGPGRRESPAAADGVSARGGVVRRSTRWTPERSMRHRGSAADGGPPGCRQSEHGAGIVAVPLLLPLERESKRGPWGLLKQKSAASGRRRRRWMCQRLSEGRASAGGAWRRRCRRWGRPPARRVPAQGVARAAERAGRGPPHPASGSGSRPAAPCRAVPGEVPRPTAAAGGYDRIRLACRRPKR